MPPSLPSRLLLGQTILVALFSARAHSLEVRIDRPDRWEAQWSLGAWTCDTLASNRRIVARRFAPSTLPGSLASPMAEATLSLPPKGSWSVEIRRFDPVVLRGTSWERVPAWIDARPVPAPPIEHPAWRVDSTPQGRLLRLSIPWAEPVKGGVRVSQRLDVVVRMEGGGDAPVSPILRPLVANPSGSARFGTTAKALTAARRQVGPDLLIPDGKQTIQLTVREAEVGDRTRDGMVRLTGQRIQGLLGNLNGVDFERVAVGVPSLGAIDPVADAELPGTGLSLVPIRRVDFDRDGVFDPQDHIEFFVQGPSFWTPDSLLGDHLFQLDVHRWDMARRYLIRLDAPQGSPEIPVARPPVAPTTTANVLRPVWAGKHLRVRVPEYGSSTPNTASGASWFWHWADSTTLGSEDLRHPAAEDLPGLAGSQGIAVVRFARLRPAPTDTFRAVGGTASSGAGAGTRWAWNVKGLKPSDNRWQWSTTSHANDFESYTIHYPHSPSVSGFKPFPAPMLGAFAIPVTGASATDSVYAVAGGAAVRVIGLADGLLRDSASTPDTWYHLAGTNPPVELSTWKAPTIEWSLSPSAMASRPRVDLLVVAPDSFLDLASQYAAFRADSRRHRVFRPGVVRTEDIWQLWGHGSHDPLAIRDLLRLAAAQWGTTHVLLLGGGHFDPRGVTGATPAPIPVWEDVDIGTDAVLGWLDPGEFGFAGTRTQDIALGRIPARSRQEVAAWLAKLRTWEDPAIATSGPWRNTWLSTADDLQVRKHGGSPDSGFEGAAGHTETAQRVVDTVLQCRPGMTLRTVYQVEYPLNAALEKPDAQRTLIDQLNRGVSAFSYFGHGGWDILADERLLDTRSALLGLTNASSPFLFYAGSCTVGRHELTQGRGLSEALVVASGKGAVAGIAATRPTNGSDNAAFARTFWPTILGNSSNAASTLGEAFRAAQNAAQGINMSTGTYRNSDLYNLLGDPAMVPYPGGSPITLDNPPDTLAALGTYDYLGSAQSQVQLSVNTRASSRTASYTYAGKTYTQSYIVPGRTLVSVRTRAENGRYKAHLLTPARFPQGDSAVVHLYSWNPSTLKDGTALDSHVVLFGIGDNPPDDRVGPRIRIMPCDSSWTAGQPYGKIAEVPVPFCLNIAFEDSSGISGSDAPDEGIILSVSGVLPAWHPTQISEGADFTQAWTRLSLDAQTFVPGKSYTLNVFARDLMGNASTASLELRTRATGDIDLYEVFNRPNPAKGDATTFYFKLLADADSNGTIPQTVQASIRIHTLSGKLVRILQTDLTDVGHPRPRAVWDLKDAFRNEVANGLYPYTILLRVRDPNTRNWRQTEKRGIIAVSR